MRGQGAWPEPTQANPSERASRAIVGAGRLPGVTISCTVSGDVAGAVFVNVRTGVPAPQAPVVELTLLG